VRIISNAKILDHHHVTYYTCIYHYSYCVITYFGDKIIMGIIVISTEGDLMAVSAPTQLWNIEKLSVCTAGQTAWCVFWVGKDSSQSVLTKTTAILEKRGGAWKMVHAQASLGNIDYDVTKSSAQI
jgi:hypothetical protein